MNTCICVVIDVLCICVIFWTQVTRYGKGEENGKGASVVEKVIKRILEKCGESGGIQSLDRSPSIPLFLPSNALAATDLNSIFTIYRIFASMDKTGDGEMDKEEMRSVELKLL